MLISLGRLVVWFGLVLDLLVSDSRSLVLGVGFFSLVGCFSFDLLLPPFPFRSSPSLPFLLSFFEPIIITVTPEQPEQHYHHDLIFLWLERERQRERFLFITCRSEAMKACKFSGSLRPLTQPVLSRNGVWNTKSVERWDVRETYLPAAGGKQRKSKSRQRSSEGFGSEWTMNRYPIGCSQICLQGKPTGTERKN